MKKLLTILFVLMLSRGYAQFTNNYSTSAPNTKYNYSGGLGASVGFLLGDFTDTATLNLNPYAKGVPGILERTGNNFVFRNTTANRWLFVGTLTNIATGLGLSGGPITTTGTIIVDTTVILDKLVGTNITGAMQFTSLLTSKAGINFTGATSPVQVGGSAGTSGQVLTSAGAGTTPTWATPTTGTVTNVATGLGLSGGPITSTGTIIADTTVVLDKLAGTNITGAMQFTSLLTSKAGINFTGVVSPLQVGGSAGTSGQVLTSAGAGTTPTWATPTTGTVTNVATGLGLSGGPITTTGTIIADTTVILDKLAGTNITGAMQFLNNTTITKSTGAALTVTAATGSSTNYAAFFTGRIGIGVSAPSVDLDVGTGSTVSGSFASTSNAGNGNFYTAGATNATGTANAAYQYLGSSNADFRVGVNGNSNTNIGIGRPYASLTIAASAIAENISGNHPLIASVAVLPPTVTGGAATVTTASTFYISGPPVGVTTTNPRLSMWVDQGTVQVDDTLTAGRIGIGTTAPSQLLEVFSVGAAANIALTNSTGTGYFGVSGSEQYFQLNSSSGTWKVYNSAGAVNLFGISNAGALTVTATNTPGGTTGNQTINKASGTVNIAAAGTTVTVTNSLVTTSSLVFCQIRTNDATASGIKNVVPGSGSFVITLNAAATAEISIGFIVFN